MELIVWCWWHDNKIKSLSLLPVLSLLFITTKYQTLFFYMFHFLIYSQKSTFQPMWQYFIKFVYLSGHPIPMSRFLRLILRILFWRMRWSLRNSVTKILTWLILCKSDIYRIHFGGTIWLCYLLCFVGCCPKAKRKFKFWLQGNKNL